jgi:predicted transcriptional regulator
MYDRETHQQIRQRIEKELGGRTWSWLAKVTGIPPSTLSNQVNRPRFTLEVIRRVGKALDLDFSDVLQVHQSGERR